MKKKGFTLVELLAVIAILAILVIIALPNVMGMFNTAKKNSFTTEVKELYKIAQQQWISDSMFETKDQEYGRCSGCSYKELDLTGRQELNYYIKINKAGNFVKYYATDGSYQFKYDGSGLLITDITDVDQVTDLDEGDIITIDESNMPSNNVFYYFAQSGGGINETVPNWYVRYSTIQELYNATGSRVFVRLTVDNDIITDAEAGINYNGTPIYLKKGASNFEINKQKLLSLFPTSCTTFQNAFYCSINDLYFELRSDMVIVKDRGINIICDTYGTTSFECFLDESA